MVPICIAIGANLGDAERTISAAVELLRGQFSSLRSSLIYASEPMYFTDQPSFMNAVCVAETDLSPLAAWRRLRQLELELGRTETFFMGPREIDLDLIAYGSLRYVFAFEDHSELIVPHPRATERRFVLEPLAEIAPRFVLPGCGVISDLLLNLTDPPIRLHTHAV